MAKYICVNTGEVHDFEPQQLYLRTPGEAIADWNKRKRRGEFKYSYALIEDECWTPKMFKEID